MEIHVHSKNKTKAKKAKTSTTKYTHQIKMYVYYHIFFKISITHRLHYKVNYTMPTKVYHLPTFIHSLILSARRVSCFFLQQATTHNTQQTHSLDTQHGLYFVMLECPLLEIMLLKPRSTHVSKTYIAIVGQKTYKLNVCYQIS